jgi:hypothetical protein
VLAALTDVPARAAQIAEECRKLLLDVYAPHSFAAVQAADRISATCSSSSASLLENISRESTSWCQDQCQGLLRE